MNLLDRLERKFGHIVIKGLMKYIVFLNGIVFLLVYLDTTGVFYGRLVLDPSLVMKGEVWRLITYVFIPPTFSLIFVIFVLMLYYMIGTALEQEWGSFKFNLYYLIGMLGTTAAAFLTGVIGTPHYINLSLFLAFARLYPDYEILLFFILPVKMKYLAWFSWGILGFTLIVFPLPLKVAAVVSIVNYFLFFGKDIATRTKTNRQAYFNRKRFMADIPKDFTIHKCTVCGITEKDNPKMDFRYCSTCEGDYEYCMDHLKNHQHIKTAGDVKEDTTKH